MAGPDPALLTPDIVRLLPPTTRLQLVRDAARQQSVELLRVLEDAGAFELPSPEEISGSDYVLVPRLPTRYTKHEFPMIAAIAEVMAEAEEEYVSEFVETGLPYESGVAYAVSRLATQPGFADWFDGFIDRFVESATRLQSQLVDTSKAQPVAAQLRCTCGPLMAAACALDRPGALQQLCKVLGDDEPLADSEVERRILVSGRVFDPKVEVDRYMWHPLRAAVMFHRPGCLDVMVSNGCDLRKFLWAAERPVNPESTRGQPFFEVTGSDAAVFLIESTVNGLDLSFDPLPEMMDRILSHLEAGHGPSRTGRQRLLQWALSQMDGDEPCLEMMAVADKHGIYRSAPEASLSRAVQCACSRGVDMSIDHIDWNLLEPKFNPLGDLFTRSNDWRIDHGNMDRFTAHLCQALIRVDRAQYLSSEVVHKDSQGARASLPLSLAMATNGATSALLTCLEHDDTGLDVLMLANIAESNGHDESAHALRAYEARQRAREALTALPCLRHESG